MANQEIHTGQYEGMDRRSDNPEWHTNKNYLLSIIFLLISNIGATIWWASSINSDVEVLKARPNLLVRVIKLETTISLQNKYFNRLDITLENMNRTITRIDREQARRKSIVDRAEKDQGRK